MAHPSLRLPVSLTLTPSLLLPHAYAFPRLARLFYPDQHSAVHGFGARGYVGLSDPFVEVHWNGALIHRTHTKQRTLNPVWGDGTKAEEEEEEEGEGRGEAAAAAAQERGEDEDERSGRERVVVNVRPDGSGGELLLSVYDADLLSTGDFLGEVNNNSNRQPSSYAPSRHLLMDASILLVDRAS